MSRYRTILPTIVTLFVLLPPAVAEESAALSPDSSKTAIEGG